MRPPRTVRRGEYTGESSDILEPDVDSVARAPREGRRSTGRACSIGSNASSGRNDHDDEGNQATRLPGREADAGPDPLENVAWALVSIPPKREDEWDYLKETED